MSALGALDRFLHAPAPGYRLASVRILFGLYLLFYLINLWPDAVLMFSNQGVQLPYLVPDYAPPPAAARALLGAMIAIDLALIVGYRSELAARLLLLLFLYHYFLQLAVRQSSYDRLIVIDLLVLCFADAGRVWGLDAQRRESEGSSVWGERVLAMQTLLLYFGSGLWKLCNPKWHTGVLLRSNMQGMWASPLAFALVQSGLSEHAWTWLSWTIIGFELMIAPLLLVRRTRPLALALGLGFHLFNTFALVIPEFLVAVASYPVFVQNTTLERVGARGAALVRALWSHARRAAQLGRRRLP